MKSIKTILTLARDKVTPPTWGSLSKYIDEKTGKERTYTSKAYGPQSRIRAWLETESIPLRYVPYIAEISGVEEGEIVMACLEAKKRKYL